MLLVLSWNALQDKSLRTFIFHVHVISWLWQGILLLAQWNIAVPFVIMWLANLTMSDSHLKYFRIPRTEVIALDGYPQWMNFSYGILLEPLSLPLKTRWQSCLHSQASPLGSPFFFCKNFLLFTIVNLATLP